MLNRTLVTGLLSLCLALAAWAEMVTVYIVEYQGEQRQELTAEKQEPVDILTAFLKSGKDGKLTVSDDGQPSLVIDKIGQDLTVSGPGAPPEKATVQEVLDMLSGSGPESNEKEE